MPTSDHTGRDRATTRDADALLKRIEDQLLARGMSKSELATKLGRSRSAVTEWWTRRSLPDAFTLVKLPDALDCSGHWLLTGEGARTTDTNAASLGAAQYAVGGLDAISRMRSLILELETAWRAKMTPTSPKQAAEQARATATRLQALLGADSTPQTEAPPHKKRSASR